MGNQAGSEEMLIGFVGGCITHQPDIPYPQLFHRVLMRWFDEQGMSGIRFVVARDPHQEPSLRVETLLANYKPDLIIMHRSAHTFFTKSMAVFYAGDRYVLHPFFAKRRQEKTWTDYEKEGFSSCFSIFTHASRPELSQANGMATSLLTPEITTQSGVQSNTNKSSNFTLAFRRMLPHLEGKFRKPRRKDLPWILGELSGLLNWALNDELNTASKARKHCNCMGAKLIVVGPGLRIGYPWVNRHAHQLDKTFQAWAEKHKDVSYISLLRPLAGNRSPNMLSTNHYLDTIHFNSSGHLHLASRLEPALLMAIAANK
ncbi:MAG: hypothetical protein VKM34_12715 [Cyanobacteriota bacterium]|nr:hypothetical protein [Cyanobacteriota bacterium]